MPVNNPSSGSGLDVSEPPKHGEQLVYEKTWQAVGDYSDEFESSTRTLEFGGDWFRESGSGNGGGYSLRSKDIDSGQRSEAILDILVPEGGSEDNPSLSFDCKVSSESTWDTLRIYHRYGSTGESLIHVASGAGSWENFDEVLLRDGLNQWRFVYAKDESSSSGNDAAYLDNVVVTQAKTVDPDSTGQWRPVSLAQPSRLMARVQGNWSASTSYEYGDIVFDGDVGYAITSDIEGDVSNDPPSSGSPWAPLSIHIAGTPSEGKVIKYLSGVPTWAAP